MWLDRLAGSPANASGSSTPNPSSRPFSPMHRKSSTNLSPYVTSQRQSHSARASSISLVSSDSSVSLLASSRRPNVLPTSRQASTIATNHIDSIEILNKLLGQSKDGQDTIATTETTVCLADLDLEFEFGGLSLVELATSQTTNDALETLDKASNDYFKEQARFEDLHKSIIACDNILSSVEDNLASFRDDLAAVSADIESLQEQSTVLNNRLENRREVEKALAPLIEELSLPPEIISKIVTGTIDEAWAKVLSDIERRVVLHPKKSTLSQGSKAADDFRPLLEKLTQKAIERIRDFIVAQIKSLRSPHINAQIIQQQNFLRFKDLFGFLHKHHPILAEEISLAYMNTMRWYYLNQFTRYQKALNHLELHTLDKNDVLGHEESTRITTVLSSQRVAGPPHDAFNLGRRVDVLRNGNQPAISSYLAEEDKATHYLEVPFRNFNCALIDNATVEYSFMVAYFSSAFSLAHIAKNFNYIFEPTFELGRTLSKSLAGETYDALGILLSIRLNQNFAFELQRRRIPVVDSYINATSMLLWPRLQVIMDRHRESVRQLLNNMPSKATRTTGEQSKMSMAPHIVTQRFGQLLHGFLAMSAEAGDDEPIVASLLRLRTEVEAYLTRLSHNFGADKRKSARFMYNNYSLILTIISDTSGKLAQDQQDHFEELKGAYQEED